MRTSAFLLLAVTLAQGGPSFGQEGKRPGSGNYLVFPVSTELQRVIYGKKQAYLVLVNADPVILKDGTIKPSALDLEGLDRAMRAHLFRGGEDEVLVSVLYRREVPKEAKEFLHRAVQGVVNDRFKKVFTQFIIAARSTPTTKDDWGQALQAIKEFGPPGNERAREDALPAGKDRVFPVRTALSRYALGGADCLVVFGTPVDAASKGDLTPAQQKAISGAVSKLDPAKRDRLAFRIQVRRDGRKAWEHFHEVELEHLRKRLGFKSYVTTFVPTGD